MPVDVEAGMYKMLRDPEKYAGFEKMLKEKSILMNYDICFRDFVSDECSQSIEYKTWFKFVEESIKDIRILFEYWYNQYTEEAKAFTDKFIEAYNVLAEEQGLDYLIPSIEECANSEELPEETPALIS